MRSEQHTASTPHISALNIIYHITYPDTRYSNIFCSTDNSAHIVRTQFQYCSPILVLSFLTGLHRHTLGKASLW